MKKVLCTIIVLASILITAFCFAQTTKEQTGSKPAFEIRKVNEQIVLYTIYRGPYEQSGQAIGKLFALAGQKGIIPRGPVQYAYLNNSQYISKEHYLIEIRIPVDKDALKSAGTLGEMTDVKVLPAIEVVVAKKPKGIADSDSIYNNMSKWIYENKYTGVDTPVEIFLSGAESGDYSQMEAEIMMPVKKISSEKNN
jgi:effector-binding domain-containing protein